jgi:hypothetical protein
MGKFFSTARSDAWANSAYIVNVTKNILGGRALMALSADPSGGRDGHALRVFFWERIEKAVSKMSSDALARICDYGGPVGLHVGPACQAEFLNMTGYKDVMNWRLDPSQKGGRGILEELAILTIVCVARDIIRQQEWQTRFARALNDDAHFERGMSDYVHRGHQR